MKKSFEIEGMSCNHCVHAVRKALSSIEGVTVDHVEIGSATIEVQNSDLDMNVVREAIEEEGYRVVGEPAH